MKKKILVMGMTLVMAAGMLTGCKELAPKEDYQADIIELAELKEVDTGADATVVVDEIGEITETMDVVTPEAKAVKESLQEYVEYVNGIDLNNFAGMGESEVEEMQERVDEICADLVDNMDEFKDNAKSAGVSADELSAVENIGMLGI